MRACRLLPGVRSRHPTEATPSTGQSVGRSVGRSVGQSTLPLRSSGGPPTARTGSREGMSAGTPTDAPRGPVSWIEPVTRPATRHDRRETSPEGQKAKHHRRDHPVIRSIGSRSTEGR